MNMIYILFLLLSWIWNLSVVGGHVGNERD